MTLRTDPNQQVQPKARNRSSGDTPTRWRAYEVGLGLAVGRQLHRDNSFISLAGVLRDKQGIEQALTSVGLRWFFQTLLQGTAPAEQIKGISNLLSIFHFILRIFFSWLKPMQSPNITG